MTLVSCEYFFDRAVYDGEQPTEFMEKLEERIRMHDKDIERMCNYHYQGFIESVNELLKVRGEARKLKVWDECIDYYYFTRIVWDSGAIMYLNSGKC